MQKTPMENQILKNKEKRLWTWVHNTTASQANNTEVGKRNSYLVAPETYVSESGDFS